MVKIFVSFFLFKMFILALVIFFCSLSYNDRCFIFLALCTPKNLKIHFNTETINMITVEIMHCLYELHFKVFLNKLIDFLN